MDILDLESWKEVTRGLYRYVIAANACYEICVWFHDLTADILNAKASLYITGEWNVPSSESYQGVTDFFSRECLLEDATLSECLEYAYTDEQHSNLR